MSRQQHQSWYENYDEDGYEDSEAQHGKQALYVVAYFALLAVFVVVANQFHVATMQAIFFAMMGAGLALALLIWLLKLMVRTVVEKLQSIHLSRREIVQYAVGYNPYAAEDTEQLPPVTEVLKRSFSGTLAPPAGKADGEEEERAARQREGRRIVLGKDQRTGKEVTITLDDFHKAVELRKSGQSTGYRDLAVTFTLSPHHAKELNRRVLEHLGQPTEQERE